MRRAASFKCKCHNKSGRRYAKAAVGGWRCTWDVRENKLASYFQMSKVLAVMRLGWLWMQGISGRDSVESWRPLVDKQKHSNNRQTLITGPEGITFTVINILLYLFYSMFLLFYISSFLFCCGASQVQIPE